jgi:hypothetical protein
MVAGWLGMVRENVFQPSFDRVKRMLGRTYSRNGRTARRNENASTTEWTQPGRHQVQHRADAFLPDFLTEASGERTKETEKEKGYETAVSIEGYFG